MKIKNNTFGVNLIELVVAIGLISVLIFIISSANALIAINRDIKYSAWATAIAQEQLEIAANQPFAALTNRTNAPFSWVPYNYGQWRVNASALAYSTPNVYELMPYSSLSDGISGFAMLPHPFYQNATFESLVNIMSDSQSGWKAGIAFGVIDNNNYYRLYYSSSSLVLDRINNGITTNLYTLNQSFSVNTWYKLKIITTSSNLEIWLDDSLINTITETFAGGDFALIGMAQAHIFFDSISLTSGQVYIWDFDSDETGNKPASWERFGLFDFPNATGLLSINDYLGSDDIKSITASVQWSGIRGSRNITLSTLKNKY